MRIRISTAVVTIDDLASSVPVADEVSSSRRSLGRSGATARTIELPHEHPVGIITAREHV